MARLQQTRPARKLLMRKPQEDVVGAVEDIKRHLDAPPDDFGVVADLSRRKGNFPGETFLDVSTLITYTWSGTAWFMSSWGVDASRNNYMDNAEMRVQQRGNAFITGVGSNPTSMDRWTHQRSGFANNSTVNPSNTVVIQGFSQYARMARAPGDTQTAQLRLFQTFPSDKVAQLQGKRCTLSWFVYNYGLSGTIGALVVSGTGGANGSFLKGTMTGAVTLSTTVVTPGAGLNYLSATFTVPGAATELEVVLTHDPTGTAGALDLADITGVQLEIGPVATTFMRRTFAEELAECQRYAFFPFAMLPAANSNSVHGWGNALGAAAAVIQQEFPVTMRAIPTFFANGGVAANWQLTDGIAIVALNAIPAIQAGYTSLNNVNMNANTGAGLVAGTSYRLTRAFNQINPGFLAEL